MVAYLKRHAISYFCSLLTKFTEFTESEQPVPLKLHKLTKHTNREINKYIKDNSLRSVRHSGWIVINPHTLPECYVLIKSSAVKPV